MNQHVANLAAMQKKAIIQEADSPIERCSLLFVLNVERKLRFLSVPEMTVLYTAVIASLKTDKFVFIL